MKSLVFIVFVLGATFCAAERQDIIGHADGEEVITVRFIVSDSVGRPLTGLRAQFFDRQQCAILEARNAEVAASGKSGIARPNPTESISREDGSLDISCRFPATFLKGYAAGKIQILATEVRPAGLFRFEHLSIGVFECDPRRVLRKAAYGPDEFLKPVLLNASPGPNQALEPTSTSVTNPAGAGFAPAVAVAHL